MADEREEPNSGRNCNDSGRESYIKHIDRIVLVHFFFVFVSSFALGLLFLHSSLSFWAVRFYDDPPIQDTQQYPHFVQDNRAVNVVSFDANSSFSLTR